MIKACSAAAKRIAALGLLYVMILEKAVMCRFWHLGQRLLHGGFDTVVKAGKVTVTFSH